MTAEVPVVQATALTRIHADGRRTLRSLSGVSLTVGATEVVAVTGPSGSGKTTLLHLLGGLDEPDEGQVRVAGVDWRTIRGEARAAFRRKTCGFVMQGFALLPQATAAENVEVPLLLDGVAAAERRTRVRETLEAVSMAAQAAKIPDQLSGGQQQRVAIARAVINRPSLILADEPTGNLDSESASAVVGLLLRCARQWGASVVLVTHDPLVSERADRAVRLHSGHLEGT